MLNKLFLLFFISSIAQADILNMDEVSVNYRNYALINDKARNTLIYPDHPKESINLNIYTTLLDYGYFNNTVESFTDSSQFRSVALQMTLGIHITDYVDFGYYHKSQHILDRPIETLPSFPTEDAIEVKLYLYRKKSSGGLF